MNGLLMKLCIWCGIFVLNYDICGFIWIFCAFKFVGSSAVQTSNIMGECHDMHGQTIEQGRHYVPGPDICKYALISIAFTECSIFFSLFSKPISIFPFSFQFFYFHQRLCICDNGHAKGCKAVLCTPPQACKSFQIGSSCCEFICLDDALSGSSEKTPDFGI